ncbi:phosphatidylinositol/phosphatidylcholine transfer protein SFH3 isoform X2 [Daucus carota subsp. sativus]|uniref:phosphatidylinositol/phosphatidylcholine transfer protein SFH3 isoform X2 n=1 Tax=Daucus carota subsp. sativus TaxID=79200 RepID=UPI003083AE2F
MALRLNNPSSCRSFVAPLVSMNSSRSFSVRSQLNTSDSHKLVLEVKEKLEKDHHSLPVGKCGRDDEEMILWFLKDRKFSVNETVSKLTKAIKWRREFGVAELSEDSVRSAAKTGKSYLHDFLDVHKRPVMMVDASKHIPGFDVFYYYYPKRLGQVLFVEAPFVFKPIWQLVKPMLKSYASLVRFCSVDEVRKEYFTEATIPATFRS